MVSHTELLTAQPNVNNSHTPESDSSVHISLSKQTQVGGKKNQAILQKLTPNTAYNITVAAVYRSGESRDLSGQGTTSMSSS